MAQRPRLEAANLSPCLLGAAFRRLSQSARSSQRTPRISDYVHCQYLMGQIAKPPVNKSVNTFLVSRYFGKSTCEKKKWGCALGRMRLVLPGCPRQAIALPESIYFLPSNLKVESAALQSCLHARPSHFDPTAFRLVWRRNDYLWHSFQAR